MSTVISFGTLQGTTGLLAEQELRAALAICAGLANKEIARAVGCSPCTVKKSIERVFYKLGVTRRAALVAKAFALGLIQTAAIAPNPGPQHTEDSDQFQGTFIA
ncbi:response regulator transcription factor [Pseudomonas fluorescens]